VSACHPCHKNLYTKPTLYYSCEWETNFSDSEKRGAIEGPIRLPLHSLLFLFNGLAFPSISRKALKFHSALFSIPTAPTNILFIINNLWEVEGALGGGGLVP